MMKASHPGDVRRQLADLLLSFTESAVGACAVLSCLTWCHCVFGQCAFEWSEDFALPGPNGVVHVIAEFDDGSGPAVFAGGAFSLAGNVPANCIARWNGASWSPLGEGVDGVVRALTVFDDGHELALYVGGEFENAGGISARGIARWNGNSWSPVGNGFDGEVYAMAVYDDGFGPALFVGGDIDDVNIKKWNGTQWSTVGGGVNNFVNALHVHDDGSGAALFVGGHFTLAGGTTAHSIAKWDGETWAPLGTGTYGQVTSFASHDDGSGPALFVGGGFTFMGGDPVVGIARWDGCSWSPVGAGLTATSGTRVLSLVVLDDGTDPVLIAGGHFTHSGALPVRYLAVWDGEAWSVLAGGTNGGLWALDTFDIGVDSGLLAGGRFSEAGEATVNNIAAWNGERWSAVSESPAFGLPAQVITLETFDDGQGVAVYAAGLLQGVFGSDEYIVAKWDGLRWSRVGDAFNGIVFTLAIFDDGTTPLLCAGGAFGRVGDVFAANVACWDGDQWSAMGDGLGCPYIHEYVWVLQSYNDGTGPALYAGGVFNVSGGQGIAKWDGESWSAPGGGIVGWVNTMTTFDDGAGSALYVGGYITFAGGMDMDNLARWDGSNWSAIQPGSAVSVGTTVALDDGPLRGLYATGRFDVGAGEADFARWDGQDWFEVGGAFDESVPIALSFFDDGRGSILFAGGTFTQIGDVEVNHVARWDGTEWAPLGIGVSDGNVSAFAAYPGENEPSLFIGGSFDFAGGFPASNISKWSALIRGDPDSDGDVDLWDYGVFQACVRANSPPACRCHFDFDWDGGLDLIDFALFQAAFTGE